MSHILDRPAWAALNTKHAAFAEGGALAKRYLPSITPFAAARDDSAESLQALGRLASPGETLVMLQAGPIALPPGLAPSMRASAVQMVAARLPSPTEDDRIVRLTEGDAPEMLALAKLTNPGPFSLKALSLGAFWGMKSNGALVAMAGERMKLTGFTELSGVCSHPDFRGRGLARLLSLHVAFRIAERGEVPYLHAFASNTAAIALYESIGFRLRREMEAAVVERQ